ncbi:hypothetical protein GCM10010349_40840 [Streptomyces flavofungini]|nr:hypothetical protein GCM10010349_40840 [Streptomyces flavofungini]
MTAAAAREELPHDSPDAVLDRLAAFPADERERERGPALARAALDRFTGPVAGDEPRHELVVTHSLLLHHDTGHLPPEPHWTGLPPELHV